MIKMRRAERCSTFADRKRLRVVVVDGLLAALRAGRVYEMTSQGSGDRSRLEVGYSVVGKA